MPTKVGIRIYQMTVCKDRTQKSLPLSQAGVGIDFVDFVGSFIRQHAMVREASPEEIERDRWWYFEPRPGNATNNYKGLVKYGISGFESDLVNSKTNKREFRRGTEHVEFIPLFMSFGFLPGSIMALRPSSLLPPDHVLN